MTLFFLSRVFVVAAPAAAVAVSRTDIFGGGGGAGLCGVFALIGWRGAGLSGLEMRSLASIGDRTCNGWRDAVSVTFMMESGALLSMTLIADMGKFS